MLSLCDPLTFAYIRAPLFFHSFPENDLPEVQIIK